MKTIKLNIEKQWYGVMNTLTDKRKRRNALIDAKREFKKDKDKVTVIKRELQKIEQDILTIENSARKLEQDFDKLSRNMGFIRLKNYVLAEAMYDNLIAYQEFIKNNCCTDDKEITNTIQQTIDLVKKLPFECGESDNDRFREVYNAIADAFIERLSDIIGGTFDQVIIELEKNEDAKIRK